MCASSPEVIWCNTSTVAGLWQFVVFTAARRRVRIACLISYKRGDLPAYGRTKIWHFPPFPEIDHQSGVELWNTGGQTPNCLEQETQQMLSLQLSLTLFGFLNLIDLHITSQLLSARPLLSQPLPPRTVHPLTLPREETNKPSRPWVLPQTTDTTQRLDSDQLNVTKLQRLWSTHCSFSTPKWWFVPIRKYVSNSYTFMNMDQCGSFVLSSRWLQSSTSLLGDDTQACQMQGF